MYIGFTKSIFETPKVLLAADNNTIKIGLITSNPDNLKLVEDDLKRQYDEFQQDCVKNYGENCNKQFIDDEYKRVTDFINRHKGVAKVHLCMLYYPFTSLYACFQEEEINNIIKDTNNNKEVIDYIILLRHNIIIENDGNRYFNLSGPQINVTQFILSDDETNKLNALYAQARCDVGFVNYLLTGGVLYGTKKIKNKNGHLINKNIFLKSYDDIEQILVQHFNDYKQLIFNDVYPLLQLKANTEFNEPEGFVTSMVDYRKYKETYKDNVTLKEFTDNSIDIDTIERAREISAKQIRTLNISVFTVIIVIILSIILMFCMITYGLFIVIMLIINYQRPDYKNIEHRHRTIWFNALLGPIGVIIFLYKKYTSKQVIKQP
jgi:hypothetical protein